MRSLKPELKRDWAKYHPKPEETVEKIRVIRDLGHTPEDIENQEKNPPRRNQAKASGGSGKRKRGGGGGSYNDERAKRPKESKDGQGEKKDRNVELKGIPANIVEERKKDDKCLKCGKGNHKWVECWTKDPVVGRVAAYRPKKVRGIPVVKDTTKEAKRAAAAIPEQLELFNVVDSELE